jgi:hypothetical protein
MGGLGLSDISQLPFDLPTLLLCLSLPDESFYPSRAEL